MLKEGSTFEIISITSVIAISQVIGWLIKESKSVLDRVKINCLTTMITFLIYLLVAVICFPEPVGIRGDNLFLIFVLGPIVMAGMSVSATMAVWFLLFIAYNLFPSLRLKRNPLRQYIIEEVLSARKVDPNLTVLVRNERVSIQTKRGKTDINFNEHGYENTNNRIRHLLIKDIRSNLGSNYKIDGDMIVRKEPQKPEEPKKPKAPAGSNDQTIRKPEYEKW